MRRKCAGGGNRVPSGDAVECEGSEGSREKKGHPVGGNRQRLKAGKVYRGGMGG